MKHTAELLCKVWTILDEQHEQDGTCELCNTVADALIEARAEGAREERKRLRKLGDELIALGTRLSNGATSPDDLRRMLSQVAPILPEVHESHICETWDENCTYIGKATFRESCLQWLCDRHYNEPCKGNCPLSPHD